MVDDEHYISPADFLADWWGYELSPATVERIATAPVEQWNSFSEDYQDSLCVNTGRRQEAADRSAVYCAVSSPSDDLYDPDLIPLGGARVRALALYAQRVIVRDPLEPLTSDFLSSSGSPFGEPPHGRVVTHCLQTLSALAPLEKSGAVRFAGLTASGVADRPEETAALHGLFTLGSELSLENLDWRWATDPSGIRGDASGVLAGMHILGQLMQARRVAPEGATFIGTPLERSVLERLICIGGPQVAAHATALANLATLAVPVLIPSSKDVVAARSSDEYASFRNDLSRALRIVEDIPSTDETWLETAREILDDELTPGRERISRAVRASKALSEIKRSASGLSISALGTGAAVWVGGKPGPSLVAATVAGVATSLKSYLAVRRGVQKQKAVLERYLTFSRPLKAT